jgi:Sec7-like guanine-nucleotide exchange factor
MSGTTPDTVNLELTKLYLDTLDFKSLSFIESFRLFMENAIIPSRLIHGSFEAFAESFTRHNQFSKESVVLLCYCVMMLNADMHNPQLQRYHTTFKMFKSHISEKEHSFPTYMLWKIYRSVKKTEIAVNGLNFGSTQQSI